MTTEIPEDVRKAAAEAAQACIAMAIMAERERCAKVAAETAYEAMKPYQPSLSVSHIVVANAIAAAIRRGQRPSELNQHRNHPWGAQR